MKLADRLTNLSPAPPDWSPARAAAYREEAVLIHRALGKANLFGATIVAADRRLSAEAIA